MRSFATFFLAAVVLAAATEGFVSPSNANRGQTQLFAEEKKGGFFGAISNFFEELDAFVDDATAR